MKNRVRIIAGKWRSRQLPFADVPGLRPTPARVRETLFNWLQYDIAGSQCLDLFAGSGALGVEAASRGAGRVVQVENNAAACRLLKANTVLLETRKMQIVQQDVFRFLAGDAERFDLIFLDPPFKRNMVVQCCHWLEDKSWLTKTAKIYVEVESSLVLQEMPENWERVKYGKAGEVGFYLFARQGS